MKLCAGWLSPPFWDVIGRTPREYSRGLWEWHACHVHYRGTQYTVPGHGWFIRRFELDGRMHATRVRVPVEGIEQDDDPSASPLEALFPAPDSTREITTDVDD